MKNKIALTLLLLLSLTGCASCTRNLETHVIVDKYSEQYSKANVPEKRFASSRVPYIYKYYYIVLDDERKLGVSSTKYTSYGIGDTIECYYYRKIKEE